MGATLGWQADGGGRLRRAKAVIISALLPARPSTRMNEHDYQLALALYAGAALGCLLVGWRITRWMWLWLIQPKSCSPLRWRLPRWTCCLKWAITPGAPWPI